MIVVTLVGGAVVFDFDDRFLSEETPTAELRFEYDEDAETLTVEHRSGNTLRAIASRSSAITSRSTPEGKSET